MHILTLDLGKFKSVFCDHRSPDENPAFGTIPTAPAALHDLVVDRQPDRLDFEVSHVVGWV